ncbi:MAG: glutamyl-tRNA reductase [Chitinophagales bacterium]|nr:glutamyl-tRNA reductase [Chitinophagales bacterium]
MNEDVQDFSITGVSYRKTLLEIRNKFAFTTEIVQRIYQEESSNYPVNFFILSTCNRTEIYSFTKQPEQLCELFTRYNYIGADEVNRYTYIKSGYEAIKHLLHVACGLDSQILGDYEIIGQLKNAFALAKSHYRTSGIMEKLMNTSLQASRQVRNRTSISDGTTSISYAVIQLMNQEIGNNIAMNICLMGLGKIGTLTLKNLKHYLPRHKVTLINRNEIRAQSAANEYNVSYATFEQQSEALQNSDVLIVATAADHPLITKLQIESSRIKLLFDLSVPSNVSDDVKEVKDLKFYDIDNLSKIVNETISKRRNQIPLASEIIEQHITELQEWERRRELYSIKEEKK